MSKDVMQRRIEAFLDGRRIALLGATNKTEKWGYKIYQALKRAGYDVFPVNPVVEAIDGDKVYPRLDAVPPPVDGVSLVIPPSATEQAVRAARELGLTRVWMQPGAESEDAIEFCARNGLECIHHRCVLVEMGA